jgi:hypothetical protein
MLDYLAGASIRVDGLLLARTSLDVYEAAVVQKTLVSAACKRAHLGHERNKTNVPFGFLALSFFSIFCV